MDAKLLEILRCPMHPDGPKLTWTGDLLICRVDGVGFRVIDGIPNMLPEDQVPPDKVAEELRKQGRQLSDH